MPLTDRLEETLEQQLLEAKKSLQGVDHDLNKLLGRDSSRMKRRLGAVSPRIHDDRQDEHHADSHEDEPDDSRDNYSRGARDFMPRALRVEREVRGGNFGAPLHPARGDYRGGRWAVRSARGRGVARGELVNDGPPMKRRAINRSRVGGEFGARPGRLSVSPEANSKPSIQSHIVGPHEISADDSKSRQVALQQRKLDKENINRSRRMFGALLGTLQRFRSDEIKLKDKEEKRAVVERKLENDARRERVELRQQKSNMLAIKKRKQQELKLIEMKAVKVKEEKEWESYQFRLMNFARTQCQPYIFFQPKLPHPNTDEMLQKTKQRITEDISVQRERLAEELSLLDCRLSRLQRVSEMDTTEADNGADTQTATTTPAAEADNVCQQQSRHDNARRQDDEKSLSTDGSDAASDDSDDDNTMNSDTITNHHHHRNQSPHHHRNQSPHHHRNQSPHHHRHRRNSDEQHDGSSSLRMKKSDSKDATSKNEESDGEMSECLNQNVKPTAENGESQHGAGGASDRAADEPQESGEITSEDDADV